MIIKVLNTKEKIEKKMRYQQNADWCTSCVLRSVLKTGQRLSDKFKSVSCPGLSWGEKQEIPMVSLSLPTDSRYFDVTCWGQLMTSILMIKICYTQMY